MKNQSVKEAILWKISRAVWEFYLANHEVGGSEVVRPLRHTMRLVDASERDFRKVSQDAAETRSSFAGDDCFGRHQKEVQLSGLDHLLHLLPLLWRLVRVKRCSFHKRRKTRHLVVHQRNQRRHNQGDGLTAAGVQVRRQLVTQTFPWTSRQCHKSRQPWQNSHHRFLLTRSEWLVTEHP